jgi:FixJ family two-component response regulator
MASTANPIRRRLYLFSIEAIDLRLRVLLVKLGFNVHAVAGVDMFLGAYGGNAEGVVLLDVALDREHDGAAVEKLISRLDHAPVIPLCESGSIEFYRKCFKAGAADVLDRSFDDQRIADAIVGASLTGMAWKGKSISMLRHGKTRFTSLTEREREVFHYLMDGFTNPVGLCDSEIRYGRQVLTGRTGSSGIVVGKFVIDDNSSIATMKVGERPAGEHADGDRYDGKHQRMQRDRQNKGKDHRACRHDGGTDMQRKHFGIVLPEFLGLDNAHQESIEQGRQHEYQQ